MTGQQVVNYAKNAGRFTLAMLATVSAKILAFVLLILPFIGTLLKIAFKILGAFALLIIAMCINGKPEVFGSRRYYH